jgi:hypothetical protein
VDLILRRPMRGARDGVAATAASASVAAGLRASREVGTLTGLAREHAERCLAAARDTLAALEEGGWRALVDQPLGFEASALGAAAVAPRTGGFDPLTAGETSPTERARPFPV